MNPTTPKILRAARALFLIGVLVGAASLTACAGDASAGAGRIVALGDSSASGPGLGPKYAGAPDECERTHGGYPALIEQRIVHDSFTNETCSGAVVSSLTTGWTYPSGNRVRAQLEALNGTESVVLLSIGINNAEFGAVTNNCLWHNFSNDDVCTEEYVLGGHNTLIDKAHSIGTTVGNAIEAIKARAPKAKVFLVGYLDLAPTSGAGCNGLLWLTANDAPVFDQWEASVNETLRAQAEAHGAHFVDAYTQSAAHTSCAPIAADRWVNNFVGPAEMVALHPTPNGADAVAQMVLKRMSEEGVALGPEGDVEPLTVKRFKPAAHGGTFSRNRPARGGAPISVRLEAVADLSFKLERVSSGRMVGGRCAALSRKNRNKPKCTRSSSRSAWWKVTLPSGRSDVYVTGRAKGRKLQKGRYRVRVKSESLPLRAPFTDAFTILGPTG